MNSNFRVAGFGIAVLGMALLTPVDVVAQTNAVQSGNWSDGATWDAGEPNTTSPAVINGGFTVTIDQPGETTNLIDVGTAAGETGTLHITGGDLFVTNPTGPDAFPSSIRLGQLPDSTGHLTMSGGTVFIDGAVGSGFAVGDLLIGDNGTGTMTMTGGQMIAADEVFIGLGAGSNGTVEISGGTIDVQGRNLLVGFGGEDTAAGLPGASGTLNLSSMGTINIGGWLFSSFDPGSSSTINQSGGTLNISGPVVLATRGDSTFDHTSGAVNANDIFIVGDNFNGPGVTSTYNISGDATLDVRLIFWAGAWGGAEGVVNQTGGTVNTGAITVGRDGAGTYNMSAGSLTQTGTDGFAPNNHLIVGQVGGRNAIGENVTEGTGFIHQTGGDVTVNTGVFLGDYDNSHGTYKISGGTLNVNGAGSHPNPGDFKSFIGDFSVGGALASNALNDSLRIDPTSPTDPQGQALDANGTFIVSGSAATINIAGNFLANPADKHPNRSDAAHPNGDNSATLGFEIFDASGTSLINVRGMADLDGAVIDLDLMGGFVPSVGTVFDLLTASSFGATGTGTTQNVGTGMDFTLAAEDMGAFSLAVVPGGNGQILQATFLAAPGLAGDYNSDGKVDAADYVMWRKNPASFGGDPGGYNTWRANFGAMAPGSGSAAVVQGVPEPAGRLLLLVGAAVAHGVRIRRCMPTSRRRACRVRD